MYIFIYNLKELMAHLLVRHAKIAIIFFTGD